jgi:RNA-directed DNA polymerase
LADTKTQEGDTERIRLNKASDTAIQRHVKIRGDANPFDPEHETYFEDRLGWKMKRSVTGQVKWLKLWWSQDKECPMCKEKITEETGWNTHHIIPREDGGSDNPSNLVLLHPNCHKQLHSQKLKIAKPAPTRGL